MNNEGLVKIPSGYNNNIAWNFNHIIIVQQILCYKLSNLKVDFPEEVIKRYSKGGKPDKKYILKDFELCRTIALTTVQKLKKDYENGVFKDYHEYQTSYNAKLTRIEEAITFNNVHEGLHLGYIMAIKRVLG